MSWCARFPRVTPVMGETPTPVTLVYPFYENDAFLARQLAHWRTWPADLTAHIRAIVVDDGSPGAGAQPQIAAWDGPFPITLYRIAVDVPWNWIAARNIGAHHAADGWLLLTDMDHVIPVETVRAAVHGRLMSHIYVFSRREHSGSALEPHKNSWLMTREMFWRVGGYDETFSGHYGSDGEYRQRCAATAPIAVLTNELIRHEFVGDSSTTRYQRKLPADREAVRAIIKARRPDWRPKVLSFPYAEVPCSA